MTDVSFTNLSTGQVETVSEGHVMHKLITSSSIAWGKKLDVNAIDVADLSLPGVAWDGVINTYSYCSLLEFLASTQTWFSEAENEEELNERIDTVKNDIELCVWTADSGDDCCIQCGATIK